VCVWVCARVAPGRRYRGWRSANARKQFVAYRTGRPHSVATRQRITLARRRRPLPSASTRARMRVAKEGSLRPAEVKAKISQSMRGRAISAETRARMSEASRRRKPSSRGKRWGQAPVQWPPLPAPEELRALAGERVVGGTPLSEWGVSGIRSLAMVWNFPGNKHKSSPEDMLWYCVCVANRMCSSERPATREEMPDVHLRALSHIPGGSSALAQLVPHEYQGIPYSKWRAQTLREAANQQGVDVPSTFISKCELFVALAHPGAMAIFSEVWLEAHGHAAVDVDAEASCVADASTDTSSAGTSFDCASTTADPVDMESIREYSELARQWRRWRQRLQASRGREPTPSDMQELKAHNLDLYKGFKRFFKLQEMYQQYEDLPWFSS